MIVIFYENKILYVVCFISYINMILYNAGFGDHTRACICGFHGNIGVNDNICMQRSSLLCILATKGASNFHRYSVVCMV